MKEKQELLTALHKYGNHLNSCSIQGMYDDTDRCTCGYWDAIGHEQPDLDEQDEWETNCKSDPELYGSDFK